MRLEDRLSKLPHAIGFDNEPTDEFLNSYLGACSFILEALQADLRDNEPYAQSMIHSLEVVIDMIPQDMNEVRQIDAGRSEE